MVVLKLPLEGGRFIAVWQPACKSRLPIGFRRSATLYAHGIDNRAVIRQDDFRWMARGRDGPGHYRTAIAVMPVCGNGMRLTSLPPGGFSARPVDSLLG